MWVFLSVYNEPDGFWELAIIVWVASVSARGHRESWDKGEKEK